MSIYLGDTPLANSAASRNIGEIIQSTIPLSDAGLHLLDGALINGAGSYAKFVTYIAGLVSNYPDLFTTEAAWQQSVTDYGVCGKFVYDSVNNTARLPKITGFVEGTTDVTALGDLVEAGLPNITGSFGIRKSGASSNTIFDKRGALSGTATTTDKSTPISTSGTTVESQPIGIDASLSNSIYGNSATVQPQSIKVLYYIVIASSITNELNLDVSDMATKSLDNLDNTGKNIANWSNNVSNCITEIPQDIKLELSSGTLTLKAGSKVYVPNGAGVFNAVTINSDLTITSTTATRIEGVLFYRATSNSLYFDTTGGISSGSSASPTKTTWMWYDTTNNKIKRSENTGSTWFDGFSFPLCIFTRDGGQISSIDQVFNGFGYIGSTVFALPGVKGLIPNGRNEDGSLKNIEFSVNNVLTYTYTNSLNAVQTSIISNSSGVATGLNYRFINGTQTSGWYFNNQENIYTYNGNLRLWCDYGEISTSSGKITYFTPKTAFHALDYNDSSTISGWAMPSSRYIDLTLGASGATYTAPANGWFVLAKRSGAINGSYIMLENQTSSMLLDKWEYGTTDRMHRVYIPVKKGDVVRSDYSMTGETRRFRFIYAEGEENV